MTNSDANPPRLSGIDFYNAVIPLMQQGRMDEAQRYYADDFVLYEDPLLPYGGVYKGFDEFLGAMGAIVDVWKSSDFFKLRCILEDKDGEHVCAIFDIEGRPGKANKVVKSVISELYRLRDGKAVECRVWYFDVEGIARAIRGED